MQAPINKALDAVIKGALKLAGPLIKGIKGIGAKVNAKVLGGDDSPEGKQKRLDKGVRGGVSAVNRMKGSAVASSVIRPVLGALRMRFGLSVLEPIRQGTRWAVHGEVQRMTEPTEKDASDGGQVEEVPVGRDDIFSTEPRKSADSWDFALRAKVPGGEVEWGLAHVKIMPDGKPQDIGPSMIITKKDLKVNGKAINLKTTFSITAVPRSPRSRSDSRRASDRIRRPSRVNHSPWPTWNFQREWHTCTMGHALEQEGRLNVAAVKADLLREGPNQGWIHRVRGPDR